MLAKTIPLYENASNHRMHDFKLKPTNKLCYKIYLAVGNAYFKFPIKSAIIKRAKSK